MKSRISKKKVKEISVREPRREKTIKKPRNRKVVFEPEKYPPYASMKHSNQVNPIAFIGLKGPSHSGKCNILVVRKLIVEPTPGVPLPFKKNILKSDFVNVQALLEDCGTQIDEYIVRAMIGRDRFVHDWMIKKNIDAENFMGNFLTYEQISVLTNYVYFVQPKECPNGGLYYDSPTSVGVAEPYAESFVHSTRGIQPVHCWVTIENDLPDDHVQPRGRFYDTDEEQEDDDKEKFDPAIHEYDKNISLKFSDDTDEEENNTSDNSPIFELPDLSNVFLTDTILQDYGNILTAMFEAGKFTKNLF